MFEQSDEMAIGGFVEPGFEGVARVFKENLRRELDHGAAFSAVIEGRFVVDIWGGMADLTTGESWQSNTVAPIFSGGKGLIAGCLLLLIERRALDLDQPVAVYWPEFGAKGKHAVLVRHIVSHLAGLPGLSTPVSPGEATDYVRMASLLAEQAPIAPAGATLYYHALTFGWLCGELIRRVDGRSVGRFLADELARPLDLDVWIGVPESERHRIAVAERDPSFGSGEPPDRHGSWTDRMRWQIWQNPPRFSSTPLLANTAQWQLAEVPATNGIAAGEIALACLLGGASLAGVLPALAAQTSSDDELAVALAAASSPLPKDGWYSLSHAEYLKAHHVLDSAYWKAVLASSGAVPERSVPDVDTPSIMLVVGDRNAGSRLAPVGQAQICLADDWHVEGGSLASVLAELWAEGVQIDWTAHFAGRKHRRVELPLYPFARVRHWIEPPSSATERKVDVWQQGQSAVARDAVIVEQDWRAGSLGRASRPIRRVVVVHGTDTLDLAEQLAGRIPGTELVDESTRSVGRFDANDLDAWIDIVGYGTTANRSAEFIAPLQRVLATGQSGAASSRPIFLCVTRGLDQPDTSVVSLAGALRGPLYRSLQVEHPWIRCRHCDFGAESLGDVAAAIEAEISAPNAEVRVSYRKGQRHVFALRSTALSELRRRSPVGADDVVLITGGTRGLGMIVAGHFARQHGVRRLALGYRTPLPPRSEWSSNHLSETVREKTRGILALEAMGVDVCLVSMASHDRLAVKREIEKVTSSIGAPTVLVHTAGTADLSNVALLDKTTAEIETTLSPKVTLAETLLDGLDPSSLRLAVLYSSVAGLVPSLAAGQIDYVVANCFLDSLASAKTTANRRVVSIQWPSWRESGMGEATSLAYARTGLLSLSDTEGLRLLDAIMDSPGPAVVMPAIVDRQTFNAASLLGKVQPATELASRDGASVDLTAQVADGLLTRRVVDIVGRCLGIAPHQIEPDVPLHRYGADSIQLAHIARQLSAWLSVDVDVALLLQYTSIAEFVKWAVERHGDALGAADHSPGAVQTSESLAVPRIESAAAAAADRRIAVIGMSCRFPGAPGIAEFKHLLDEGLSAISAVPEHRWGRSTTHFAGLLDDIAGFDADYFGIAPEDAAAMDPQALLLLEEALSAIYHAGYEQREVQGRPIGVYVGARSRHVPDNQTLSRTRNPIVAISPNYLASNISYFFDLQGPSLVVDTACSSALVAMDVAVGALRAGSIEAAIVAGVSLLDTPSVHDVFEQRGLLKAGREFHVMDQRGDGIVPGEGAGVVVLKSLTRALADGDRVYATIEGLAINNDGRTNGPAMPSFAMQKSVMERALAQTGRRPEDIGYIDLNASGSEISDLIELRAVDAVYGSATRSACNLGSVKPNIGHTLAAHGMASFIKTVLMLHYESVPPSLAGRLALTHFPIDESCFEFARARTRWQGGLAAISVFADGGTNAHAIVGASPQARAKSGGRVEH